MRWPRRRWRRRLARLCRGGRRAGRVDGGIIDPVIADDGFGHVGDKLILVDPVDHDLLRGVSF